MAMTVFCEIEQEFGRATTSLICQIGFSSNATFTFAHCSNSAQLDQMMANTTFKDAQDHAENLVGAVHASLASTILDAEDTVRKIVAEYAKATPAASVNPAVFVTSGGSSLSTSLNNPGFVGIASTVDQSAIHVPDGYNFFPTDIDNAIKRISGVDSSLQTLVRSSTTLRQISIIAPEGPVLQYPGQTIYKHSTNFPFFKHLVFPQKDVVILLDCTLTIGDAGVQAATQAANVFLRATLSSVDRVLVLAMNGGGVFPACPGEKFAVFNDELSSTLTDFMASLRALGGFSVGSALEEAIGYIESRDDKSRQPFIVLFSDGIFDHTEAVAHLSEDINHIYPIATVSLSSLNPSDSGAKAAEKENQETEFTCFLNSAMAHFVYNTSSSPNINMTSSSGSTRQNLFVDAPEPNADHAALSQLGQVAKAVSHLLPKQNADSPILSAFSPTIYITNEDANPAIEIGCPINSKEGSFKLHDEHVTDALVAGLHASPVIEALRSLMTGATAIHRIHIVSTSSPFSGRVVASSSLNGPNHALIADLEGQEVHDAVINIFKSGSSQASASLLTVSRSGLSGQWPLRQHTSHNTAPRNFSSETTQPPWHGSSIVTVAVKRFNSGSSLAIVAVVDTTIDGVAQSPQVSQCGSVPCFLGPLLYHRTDLWAPSGLALDGNGAPIGVPTFQAAKSAFRGWFGTSPQEDTVASVEALHLALNSDLLVDSLTQPYRGITGPAMSELKLMALAWRPWAAAVNNASLPGIQKIESVCIQSGIYGSLPGPPIKEGSSFDGRMLPWVGPALQAYSQGQICSLLLSGGQRKLVCSITYPPLILGSRSQRSIGDVFAVIAAALDNNSTLIDNAGMSSGDCDGTSSLCWALDQNMNVVWQPISQASESAVSTISNPTDTQVSSMTSAVFQSRFPLVASSLVFCGMFRKVSTLVYERFSDRQLLLADGKDSCTVPLITSSRDASSIATIKATKIAGINNVLVRLEWPVSLPADSKMLEEVAKSCGDGSSACVDIPWIGVHRADSPSCPRTVTSSMFHQSGLENFQPQKAVDLSVFRPQNYSCKIPWPWWAWLLTALGSLLAAAALFVVISHCHAKRMKRQRARALANKSDLLKTQDKDSEKQAVIKPRQLYIATTKSSYAQISRRALSAIDDIALQDAGDVNNLELETVQLNRAILTLGQFVKGLLERLARQEYMVSVWPSLQQEARAKVKRSEEVVEQAEKFLEQQRPRNRKLAQRVDSFLKP